MKNLRTGALLLIAVCTQGIFAFKAADVRIKDTQVPAKDTLNVRQFLEKTSMDYAWELNLAKQVKTKTQLSRIREYATKTIDICILANRDMQVFARPAGAILADSTSVPRKIQNAIFASKTASDINKTYLLTSISNHKQIIGRYEQAVLFSDTAIANMAKRHLLSLRRNLEMAKYLSKNLNNGKLKPDGPPKEEEITPVTNE